MWFVIIPASGIGPAASFSPSPPRVLAPALALAASVFVQLAGVDVSVTEGYGDVSLGKYSMEFRDA